MFAIVLPNLADSFPCLGEGRLVGNYANNDEPHTIKGGKGAANFAHARAHDTNCTQDFVTLALAQ